MPRTKRKGKGGKFTQLKDEDEEDNDELVEVELQEVKVKKKETKKDEDTNVVEIDVKNPNEEEEEVGNKDTPEVVISAQHSINETEEDFESMEKEAVKFNQIDPNKDMLQTVDEVVEYVGFGPFQIVLLFLCGTYQISHATEMQLLPFLQYFVQVCNWLSENQSNWNEEDFYNY
jgi:hypothetical protein